MKSKTIYFIAGEVSADNHGAALMRCLRGLDSRLQFVGRGGPQMREMSGEQFKNWIGEAAVLGLWEVLRKYGYFREQFHETLREIRESKPDAVVLIDYPGFNLRLARTLRRQAPRQKIIYYISPQVWAWDRGRIKRMAHFIDLVLCILPFEVAAASKQLAREMKPAVDALDQSQDGEAIQIKVDETAVIMQRAWAGIVASGSATLEAAYFRLPFVLIYKVMWPTYLAARLVVNVKYLGMPNLLADKEVVPEFIQYRAKPRAVVEAVQPLIENANARERMISEFDSII